MIKAEDTREYVSLSPDETKKIGYDLAKSCVGGETFLLSGELGAGKTVFAKGFAEGLGISDNVTSPTFAVHNSYSGKLILNHFDFYRFETPEEAALLGLDEFFGRSEGVCLIEWWQNVEKLLPRSCTEVRISALSENKRSIVVNTKNFGFAGGKVSEMSDGGV